MRKDEPDQGPDPSLIYGRNPVREALEQDDARIEKVYIQKGAHGEALEQIRRTALRLGVQVQFVPAARLRNLTSGGIHQGVVLVASSVKYLDVDDMLRMIAPTLDDVQQRKPVIVILDEIQDPHNYGAILRSAVAAGLQGVIVPTRKMAPLTATAIKASAGAALRIPIARTSGLSSTIVSLKERGYWIAGAAVYADNSVWNADWNRPLALVVGGEGSGIRQSILDACDFLVSIPMRGPVQSLNASVAAGILFFAATRARQ